MIVTRSHFTGLISIPHINDNAPNSDLLGNRSELQLFIDECEREALVKMLGPSLYSDFLPNIENYGTIKASADQKWKDLLNGKEYEKNGCKYYWKGLNYQERSIQISPLAYYVFFYYLESDLSRYHGAGLVSEKTKNAVRADPTPRALRAWNKFYRMTVKSKTLEVSLYDFICDMNKVDSTTYPYWVGYSFKPRNFASI